MSEMVILRHPFDKASELSRLKIIAIQRRKNTEIQRQQGVGAETQQPEAVNTDRAFQKVGPLETRMIALSHVSAALSAAPLS